MTIEELIIHAYEHFDDAQILQQVGYELESRSRLDVAESFLRRAITLDPGAVREAYVSLAFALVRSSSNRQADALDVLRQGVSMTGSPLIRAWAAGLESDPTTAASTFASLASEHDPFIVLSVASAMLWQDMQDDAQRLFEGVVPIAHTLDDGPTLDAFLSVGATLQRASRFDITSIGYRSLVERMIELAPSSYGTYACAVGVYRSIRDYTAAIEVARRGLLEMPDEESLMMYIGDCYLQLDDLHRAEHWLLRAIGAKPSFIGARIVLARAYNKADRIDDALGLVREFPIANPGYAWGLIMGAALLWSRDHRDEAIEMARGAVGHLPSWAMQAIESNETYTALWTAVTATDQN